MLMPSLYRHIPATALLATALLATGCAAGGDDFVGFRTLTPRVSPYSEVTVEIDYERRTIRAIPDPVIIWVDSKNPLSQILWTVRCSVGEGKAHDDVACPDDATVILRPKPGCSKTLFGSTAGAPEGEIHIRAPTNAVASGVPNLEEAEALFTQTAKSDTFCDGSDKASHGLMKMRESVHDLMWVYEIEVRQPDQDSFKVDPAAWIEKDH